MRLKIICTACGCRYAVIGAAFFWPACGHNAVDLMCSQAVSSIRSALDSLPEVRAAIPDRDTAEIIVPLIAENGLQSAGTAFQRYAEVLYTRYSSLPPLRRNAFQNLRDGSDLWFAASGKHYGNYLATADIASLTRFFQQRHLLAHTQGRLNPLEHFRPNPAFIRLMHHVIKTFGPDDPALQEAASQQQEGWLYIVDLRTPEGPEAEKLFPAIDLEGIEPVEAVAWFGVCQFLLNLDEFITRS